MSKKLRLGLRTGVVTAPAFSDINDLFLPAETVLKKAGQGFSRGPKAGHKYWRRQRVLVGGKMRWRYYYNTEKDRKRWLEDRAALLKRKRKGLSEREKRLAKEAEASHGEGHVGDHPEIKTQISSGRRELRALSTEYLNTLLGFENQPTFKISESAREQYIKAVEDLYNGEEDPLDPHGVGANHHALRTIEQGLKLIPKDILGLLDGAVSNIELVTSVDAASKESTKYAAGFCSPRPRAGNEGEGSRLVFILDRMYMEDLRSAPYPKDGVDPIYGMYGMRGGAFQIEVVVHELAHAVHNRMGAYQVGRGEKEPNMPGSWKGASWSDYLKFLDENSSRIDDYFDTGKGRNKKKFGKSRGEKGITAYSNENHLERWAESFTACLMYPHQMAAKCPLTYDWFRENIFGPEAMHPRVTDKVYIAKLEDDLRVADNADDRKLIKAKLEKAKGLEDMAPSAPELQWWNTQGDTDIQAGLSAAMKDNPSFMPAHTGAGRVYRVDPPDMDKTGQQKMKGRRKYHDRFYEMNYKGRTIYMRYGPPAGKAYKHWEPNVEGRSAAYPGNNKKADKEALKEVYDENGNPIHPDLMYLHLVQDELEDGATVAMVTIRNKKLPVMTEDIRAFLEGTASAEQTERVKKVIGPDGKAAGPAFLRKWTKDTTNKGIKQLQDLYTQLNALSADDPGRQKLMDKISAEEDKLNDVNWDQIGSAKGGMPAPVTMAPHELTLREFKQRSGTFAYDNIQVKGQALLTALQKATPGSAKHRKLLTQLRKEQPGIMIENRRDPKTGRFRRGNVRLDGQGRPMFNVLRYVNENPDGSQTIIDTVRDEKTGRMTIQNPMWRDLLTPNGEEVRSAGDLQRLMQAAAGEKRRVWVSLETDRRRIPSKTGKSYKMEKPGDTGHHYHIEVEFDGAGQPKIVGDYWKQILGKDTPRLDDLIKDDPLFGKFRKNARAIIEGEAITFRKEVQAAPYTAKNMPRVHEKMVLSVTGSEQRSMSAKDKDIVAQLVAVVQGKKAGELPPAPGWDRMPEGSRILRTPETTLTPAEADALLADNLKGKKFKALRAKIRQLKRSGVLPEWYSHSPSEANWYRTQYEPAYKEWNKTKEIKRQEEYETKYIFQGTKGGGASGQIFYREESELLKDIRPPAPALVPRRLKHHTLAYVHNTVDPRTGLTVESEVRLMPSDASLGGFKDFLGLPGCTGVYRETANGQVLVGVSVKVDKFAQLRSELGALSITDEVNDLLAARYATAKAAEIARREESHVIEREEIDPANLRRQWGVRLNENLPNGAAFTLGQHQQKLLQKMLDNDGRVLACHYMGTGKTVSALSAAQIMLRRPYRPEIPADLVGEDRQRWLEENPWDTSRLHPDNPKRILVVAPLNTVEQWRQSAYDFDDGAQVVGSGSNDIPIDDFTRMNDDQRSEIVVVGPEYFTLHADKLKACGFDGLVIDEVHMGIKNEDANRNRKVREWNEDMKMMMLLTGTPMTTHPADFVEYIRLLSKGAVFGDMTKAKFIEEYCMESDIPAKTGAPGAGPKVKIKPEKMAELSAILDQYMDIALPKDVRGKTLPATRVEEGNTAVMSGIQENLFNLYMGALSQSVDVAGLSEEEIGKLNDPALRKKASAAKALANCIGYKPADGDEYIMIERPNPETGGIQRIPFEPFNPGVLKKVKKGSYPRWPNSEAMNIQYGSGLMAMLLYDTHFKEVLGTPYHLLAGKPIGYGIQINGKPEDPFKLPVTKAQTAEAFRRMEEAGWPSARIANPDRGPLGIRFRGTGISLLNELREKGEYTKLRKLQQEIDEAAEFQRAYRRAMLEAKYDKAYEDGVDPEDVLIEVAKEFNLPQDVSPYDLLSMNPNPVRIQTDGITLTHGGEEVDMIADETWVSDASGSRHLLYEAADWDIEKNQPKAAGPVTPGTSRNSMIGLSDKILKKMGYEPPKGPKRKDFPKGKEGNGPFADAKKRHEEVLSQWHPPKFQLIGIEGDVVQVRIMSGPQQGQIIEVKAKDTIVSRPSLMDPGRRASRRRADLAMVHQNAKADEMGDHIRRFHDGQRDGVEGKRQMVFFGNGILDACRTMEAKMRQLGFVDVNEALEGSPHFDPADPVTKGDPPSPIGKYFVTYIGGTYTGNRELNVSIFQKVKDKLNRDSDVSLFVHKCSQGRSPSGFEDPEGNKYSVDWQVYPGDINDSHLTGTPVASISMSQWTAEQREVIKGQFGIVAPEAYLTIEKNGTESPVYFYGKQFTAKEQRDLQARMPTIIDGGKPLQYKTSADLLRAMTLAGDPARLSARRLEIQNKLIAAGADQSDIEAYTAWVQRGIQDRPIQAAADLARGRLLKTDPQLVKRLDELVKEQKKVADNVAKLKAAYTEIAHTNSTDNPPLSAKQEHVFNNCEAIICSDAAQVGMNLGNSVEMVMYDTLGSPMAEAQRMTRCARMLPGVIPEKLMGTKRMIEKTRIKRDGKGQPIMENGKVVRVPIMQLTSKATAQIEQIRNQMSVSGVSQEKKEELQAEINRITKSPASREPVMVQATDELDRPIFEDDGPFTALRRMEADIFKVSGERVYNPGTVANVKMGGAIGGGVILDGDRATLPQVLGAIRQQLLAAADDKTSPLSEKKALRMAARCQAAANKGRNEAKQMLIALTKEVIPDTSETYIKLDLTEIDMPQHDEGTYGGEGMVLADGVTNAVRDWIDSQPQTIQDAIMKAGFTATENGEASSHDAAGVYLAIRAQEILKWMEDNRGPISEEMRSEPGGEILTDNEVTNRLLDMLTPMDRAILKEKKYLVNVRKLTAGGNVGQSVSYEDEDGNRINVFTGYEREWPVSTERKTQTVQRARHRAFEEIIHACQNGVEFRAAGHFVSATAGNVASISTVQGLAKSWALATSALVFDLDALEAAWQKQTR